MCVVVDSAIWFSLHCGELHLKVLGLDRNICSVDVVIDELIGNPHGADLVEKGLTVKEVRGEYIERAIQWRAQAPELSVADVFSLALALQENCRLATRDGALERLAGQIGVEVIHVTVILEMMAEVGLLTEADIRRFKKGMHATDRPYDKAHLDRVLKMVRSAG